VRQTGTCQPDSVMSMRAFTLGNVYRLGCDFREGGPDVRRELPDRFFRLRLAAEPVANGGSIPDAFVRARRNRPLVSGTESVALNSPLEPWPTQATG
jgi:hypothetical protein